MLLFSVNYPHVDSRAKSSMHVLESFFDIIHDGLTCSSWNYPWIDILV